MNERRYDPEEENEGIRVLLPSYNEILEGYPCARGWCEEREGHLCGCPKCLDRMGLTLVYDGPTALETDQPSWQIPRRIVKRDTGVLFPELIVPGYPGRPQALEDGGESPDERLV